MKMRYGFPLVLGILFLASAGHAHADVYATCSASPSTATVGQSVTWTVSATSDTQYRWYHVNSCTSYVPIQQGWVGACSFSFFAQPSGSWGDVCNNSSYGDGYTGTHNCQVNVPSNYGCNNQGTQYNTYSCNPYSDGSPYTYSWSGTDGLSGSSNVVTKSYSTTGTKTASVTVTNSLGNSKTVSCSNSVSVGGSVPPPPTGLSYSCASDGNSVTFSWNAMSGATGYYVRHQLVGQTSWFDDGLTSATSQTVGITPGQQYDWWIHSNNAYGYSAQTNGARFTCNAAAQADLTAGSVSPSSASAGSSKAFSATASNIGAGASGSFPVRFQVQESGDSFISSYVGGFSAGGSGSASGSYTFSSAGTYHVRACANQNSAGTNIVTESNYGNNCGAWTTVTVSAPSAANLTAGSISPTSTNVNVSTSFSSTVTNGGGTSTGASFSVLFQKASDSLGTGATDLGSVTTATLTAGNYRSVSYSFTPTVSGTFYMRACADKSSAGDSGSISESNENDNCGNWTAVTVTSAPSLSCTVTPTSVTTLPGTVTYTASGASAPYTWNDSVGGSYGTTASVARTISAAGSYAMTVSKSGYTSAACPTVTGGNFCSSGSPTLSITATPNRVKAGGTSLISWSASNVLGPSPSCTVTRSDSATPLQTAAAGAPPTCAITNSSSNQTITSQTIFRITCGAASASAMVNVVPGFVNY